MNISEPAPVDDSTEYWPFADGPDNSVFDVELSKMYNKNPHIPLRQSGDAAL